MDKQDKNMVNAWIEAIKNSPLKDLTAVLDSFDLAVNFSERMATHKEQSLGEGVRCNCKAVLKKEKPKYFWVDDTADSGMYRFFYRGYRFEKRRNILIETLIFNSEKGKWVCVGDTFSQEYEEPFRLIAAVNIIKTQPDDKIEYRQFYLQHIRLVTKERTNILNEAKELAGKV